MSMFILKWLNVGNKANDNNVDMSTFTLNCWIFKKIKSMIMYKIDTIRNINLYQKYMLNMAIQRAQELNQLLLLYACHESWES